MQGGETAAPSIALTADLLASGEVLQTAFTTPTPASRSHTKM
jgi:hypothetical protein